jgi:hypothetical protein
MNIALPIDYRCSNDLSAVWTLPHLINNRSILAQMFKGQKQQQLKSAEKGSKSETKPRL